MKSGIVAIIGRPSSGKSTFVNAVCGYKVSIVSAVPQTTRVPVRGIVTNDAGQLVFIDTPGYHKSEKKFNKKLRSIACEPLADADAVLYIVDASRPFGDEEQAVCELVAPHQHKLCVVLNKMDIAFEPPGMLLLQLLSALPEYPQDKILEMSAIKKTGLTSVCSSLMAYMPVGPLLYPDEFYTDQEVGFRITEIVREQAILHTRDEIPHALYVRIDDMTLTKNGKRLAVRCSICVERESQKPVLIGKGGKRIQAIRVAAEQEAREIFPYYVNLHIEVRVDKNWRQKDFKSIGGIG